MTFFQGILTYILTLFQGIFKPILTLFQGSFDLILTLFQDFIAGLVAVKKSRHEKCL